MDWGSPCRMSIIRNGIVALSNLRKPYVGLSNSRTPHVAMSILKERYHILSMGNSYFVTQHREKLGIPHFMSKGNPTVWDCYCSKKIIKCISAIKGPTIPYFSLRSDSTFIGLSHKGIPFYFQGIPLLVT